MQIFVDTIEEYIAQIPEERRDGFRKLLEIVDANLPMGFQQTMQYGMVTWCVPLENLSSRLSLRQEYAASFPKRGISKKLCRILQYEDLCRTRDFGLVCRRVSETFQKEIGYGKILYQIQKD